MGGGAELAPMAYAKQESYGINDQLGSTGRGFMNDLLSRQNQGLPEDLKALIRNQAEALTNAQLTSAKRQAKEGLAGRQVPTGAIVRTMADLFTNKANTMLGVNKDIAMGDYQAKESNRDKALSGYVGLQGLANSIASSKNSFNLQNANMTNNYNTQKYQVDKANEFNWGQALGDVFGLGGTIGGAMIGKKPVKPN